MRHAVRSSRFVSLCLLILAPLLTETTHASEERQLVAAINDYRAHPQGCYRRPAQRLAPLPAARQQRKRRRDVEFEVARHLHVGGAGFAQPTRVVLGLRQVDDLLVIAEHHLYQLRMLVEFQGLDDEGLELAGDQVRQVKGGVLTLAFGQEFFRAGEEGVTVRA